MEDPYTLPPAVCTEVVAPTSHGSTSHVKSSECESLEQERPQKGATKEPASTKTSGHPAAKKRRRCHFKRDKTQTGFPKKKSCRRCQQPESWRTVFQATTRCRYKIGGGAKSTQRSGGVSHSLLALPTWLYTVVSRR